jgi:cleavage and polyadenylation specificity factor subunit 1
VTVAGTRVTLYAVRLPGDASPASTRAPGWPRSADLEAARLEEVATLDVAGVPESAATLPARSPGAGRDALVLTFRDAKAVVLDWDEAAGEIRPTSLHALAGVADAAGRVSFPRAPRAAADPEGRAAAVALHGCQLAVLPALDADEIDDLLAADAPLGPSGASAPPRLLPATVGNAALSDLSAHGVTDVVDLAFLHGAATPTLAILHAPSPVWAGTAAGAGGDGRALVALALDPGGARPPTRLWSVGALPADARSLAPAPGGGVMVVCKRLLLFASSSGGARADAPAALALAPSATPAPAPPPRLLIDSMVEVPSEAAARHAAQWAGKLNPAAAASAAAHAAPPPPGLDADGAGAAVAWLADGLALVALASGQLLAVRVAKGAAGGAASLSATRVGAASPATALVAAGPGLAFLGSWGGDSLLLRVEAGAEVGPALLLGDGKRGRARSPDAGEAEGQGGAKRPRTALLGDDDDGADSDEPPPPKAEDGDCGPTPALFRPSAGAPAAAPDPDASVHLRVLDSLPGTGPVRAAAVCEAPPRAAGAAAGAPTPPPLLVAAVGVGRSGALLAMRRSLAPDVVTDVPLPGLVAAFALHLADGADGGAARAPPRGAAPGHPLGYHSHLLLAMAATTKVLRTGDALDEVTDGGSGFETRAATLAAATLRGGAAAAQVVAAGVVLVPAAGAPTTLPASSLLPSGEAIVAGSAAGDWVGVRGAAGGAALARLDAAGAALAPAPSPRLSAGAPVTALHLFTDSDGWVGAAGCVAAAVARADGSLELWRVGSADAPPSPPSLAARYAGLADGARVLTPTDAPAAYDAGAAGAPPAVVEVSVVPSAGGAHDPDAPPAAPFLVAVSADGDVAAWRAGRAGGGRGPGPVGGAPPRWARVPLRLPPGAASPASAPGSPAPPILHTFTALGESAPRASGVAACGARPFWLVAARGTLVAHPAAGPPVTGFAPFHNVNCCQGFLTAAPPAAPHPGGLRVCALPPGVRLDTPWPSTRVPLRGTPRALAHHAAAGVWAVALTRPRAPPRAPPPAAAGGDPAAAYAYASLTAAVAAGDISSDEVRLLSPNTWRPLWRHALAAGEAATALASVALRDGGPGAAGPLVPLIAVGTACGAGEDYPASGRVLLIEVRRTGTPPLASAVPPVGAAPLTGDGAGWEAAVVYSRELRGPVTGLAALDGALILSYGARVEGHGWAEGRLTRTAFYDAPLFATSLAVVKNFVLFADAHKGLRFLHCVSGVKNLIELSRDFDCADGLAAGYAVCGRRLALVLADGGGTLRAMSYDAAHPDSWRGKRLLPIADVHVGVVSLVALPARAPVPAGAPRTTASVLPRVDGGVGVLLPLWDAGLASSLASLSRAMATGVAAPAGLHPAAFRSRGSRAPRALGGGRRWGAPAGGGPGACVDLDLIARYADLPRPARDRVAARAGAGAGALAAAAAAALAGAGVW